MKSDERNKKQFKQKEHKFTSKKFSNPKESGKYKDFQYDHYVEGINLGRVDSFEF